MMVIKSDRVQLYFLDLRVMWIVSLPSKDVNHDLTNGLGTEMLLFDTDLSIY